MPLAPPAAEFRSLEPESHAASNIDKQLAVPGVPAQLLFSMLLDGWVEGSVPS